MGKSKKKSEKPGKSKPPKPEEPRKSRKRKTAPKDPKTNEYVGDVLEEGRLSDLGPPPSSEGGSEPDADA